jgi:PAS domain S-box-containing protein
MEDEAIYRTLFEHSGAGIFQTSPEGRFVRANPALARMLGYGSVARLLAELDDIAGQLYVEPGRRDEMLRAVRACGRVANFVSELRRREGATIWVSETVTEVQRQDGQRWYVGTMIDVSELVHTQQALSAAERSYSDIFHHAAEGIYRSSPDGRQLCANPALVRLNGYDSEAEMLAAIGDLAVEWYVEPGRRAEFKRLLERDGRVTNFESEVYRHKTRERIWVSENARLARDVDGAPLYYEGSVLDVTARKQAEEAMRRAAEAAEAASRSKTAFLANITHELRTPLNAIIGFTDMMRAEMFGPLGSPRYADYLGDVQDSAYMLLKLIEDILDVSKAEAGKLALDEEAVALGPLVAACLRMLETRARSGEVKLASDLPAALPQLLVDARRFRQIVLNLLSNAVKFTPEGGRVEISAWMADDGGVALAVADTGIGMSEDEMRRALEPFVQLDRAGRRKQEGTGLGLPLCRQLVELHGGALTLASVPGEGTVATVRLPPGRTLVGERRLSA